MASANLGKVDHSYRLLSQAIALIIIGCLTCTLAVADVAKPRAFIDASGTEMPLDKTYTITPDSKLSADPWPFAASEVVYFCTRPSIAAYGFDGKFGSLNGATTLLARRGGKVVDADGSKKDIVSASDNRFQVEAGLLSKGASNGAIGSWHYEMLKQLLTDCSDR